MLRTKHQTNITIYNKNPIKNNPTFIKNAKEKILEPIMAAPPIIKVRKANW